MRPESDIHPGTIAGNQAIHTHNSHLDTMKLEVSPIAFLKSPYRLFEATDT